MALIYIPGVHVGNPVHIIRNNKHELGDRGKRKVIRLNKGLHTAVRPFRKRRSVGYPYIEKTLKIIKHFNENTVINNYFQEREQTMINNNYNPVERVVELYNLLLDQEREKVQLLQARIIDLEKKLSESDAGNQHLLSIISKKCAASY